MAVHYVESRVRELLSIHTAHIAWWWLAIPWCSVPLLLMAMSTDRQAEAVDGSDSRPEMGQDLEPDPQVSDQRHLDTKRTWSYGVICSNRVLPILGSVVLSYVLYEIEVQFLGGQHPLTIAARAWCSLCNVLLACCFWGHANVQALKLLTWRPQ